MDYKYIEQLLERYWQCETSLEEENILRTFFSQKDVPAEMQQYRSLFVYEQQSKTEDMLDESFDERILAMIDEPKVVKAKHISLKHHLMPLGKAAAVVAIILTFGNAISVTLDSSNTAEQQAMAEFESNSDTIQLLTSSGGVYKIDSMLATPAKNEIDSMIQKMLMESSSQVIE
jgi:hypothetical protein